MNAHVRPDGAALPAGTVYMGGWSLTVYRATTGTPVKLSRPKPRSSLKQGRHRSSV